MAGSGRSANGSAIQAGRLFIITEQATIVNMARLATTRDLDLYRGTLQRWIPTVQLQAPAKPLAKFDAIATWKAAGRHMRYLALERRHLRNQDVAVVAEQLNRARAALPLRHADDRILVLAPFVRPQQGVVLERAQIDYVDLAGNAHLQVPGLFVHVEGRRMAKQAAPAPGRVQKGWIRTALAILLEPELVNAPYRTLAGHANVALGTVASCMNDLTRRALLVDGKRGRTLVDYEALVALWVQAYVEGLRPGLELRRFQMRADDKQTVWTRLRTVLTARAQPWALTGADAAERRTHFFRAEETEIYSPIGAFDDRELQRALLVQPAVRGGNLWVIEPPIPLALPANTRDIPTAADLLAYAELRHRGTAQALEAAALLLPSILDHAAH
jgi:hypothetical protein